MKKFLLFILLICPIQLLCAQSYDVNPHIKPHSGPTINKVVEVWESYISARQQNQPADEYWATSTPDLLPMVFDGFYTDALHRLVDVTSERYHYCLEIYTSYSKGRIHFAGGFMYKIMATNTDKGIKLFGYIDDSFVIETHKTLKYVDYYTDSFSGVFTPERADEQVKKFVTTYGLTMDRPLIIAICSSGLSTLGLDYSVDLKFSSRDSFYGDGYVISGFILSFSDCVRAIMYKQFKHAPEFLSNGFLSFICDGEKTLKYNRREAAKYLSRHNVDFTTSEHLDASSSSLNKALGKALVEYCYNATGPYSVIQLFEANDYDGVFERLGIAPADRTDFVYKLFNVKRK